MPTAERLDGITTVIDLSPLAHVAVPSLRVEEMDERGLLSGEEEATTTRKPFRSNLVSLALLLVDKEKTFAVSKLSRTAAFSSWLRLMVVPSVNAKSLALDIAELK